MAIRTIHISTQSGRQYTIAKDGTAQAIGVVSPIKLSKEAGTGNSIVISRSSTDTIFKQALDSLLDSRYVTRIAGAAPDSYGQIYLFTDQCMAWKPVEDRRHTIEQIDADGHIVPVSAVSDGITVFDLCPACEGCEARANVLAWLEWLLLGFNNLKDMALYSEADIVARRNYLLSERIDWNTGTASIVGCSARLDRKYYPDPNNNLPELITNMLGNYLTLVQMWNYVVSQNNSSTQIVSAAEDSSGMYIQTKRDLPVCGSAAHLECNISVVPQSVESDISMAVISTSSSFEPFDDRQDVGIITIEHVSAVAKNIHIVFNSTGVAGTYIATVKLIPFVAIELTDDRGNPINLTSIDWSANSHVEGEEDNKIEVIELGALMSDSITLPAATKEDYDTYKLFPSHSVAGVNRWRITITWSLMDMYSETGTKTWEDTYIFETNRCRKPITGLLRDWEIPINTPGTTNRGGATQ